MKFLIDAQLPRRMCAWIGEAGHDVLHTLDLPAGNISNAELETLVRTNVDTLARAFENARFVELGRRELLVHE